MDRSWIVTCPLCRVENALGRTACWNCEAPLPAQAPRGMRLRIGSLMVVIALVAVGLALYLYAPALLVVLALPTLGGLVRAGVVANSVDDRARGRGPVMAFALAFLIGMGIEVAAGIAFFASCSAVVAFSNQPFGGDLLPPALAVGAVAAVATAIGILIALARAARKERSRLDETHGSKP